MGIQRLANYPFEDTSEIERRNIIKHKVGRGATHDRPQRRQPRRGRVVFVRRHAK